MESAGRWPHLGFIYLAGEARKAGFHPVIHDAMSRFDDLEAIRRRIEAERPAFVATSAYTATFPAALEVLRAAKAVDPAITTLAGGIHPTFMWEETLTAHGDCVDFCVLGEGERTLPELLAALRDGGDPGAVRGIAFRRGGRPVRTAPRPLVADLDTLAPAWDLVDWDDYPLYFMDGARVAILNSSRGCTNRCAFCSQHLFWQGTWRARRPERFVAEIESLYRGYGVNVFFVADEVPTRDRARWERILDLLAARRLPVHLLIETCTSDILRDADIMDRYREAGILFVYVGVEAGTPERLAFFQKDVEIRAAKRAIDLIKGAGMIAESALILGTPDETEASVREALELARYYDPDYMHFLLLAPWPYAGLYPELAPHVAEHDYAKYNLVEPVIRPRALSRKRLKELVLACYREFYMEKLPAWLEMEGNDLKRECLLRGMEAIMENSYLKRHHGDLGGMPQQVRLLVARLAGRSGG
nr:radical SAM protein [Dissulfurirhabdus thermomarina]